MGADEPMVTIAIPHRYGQCNMALVQTLYGLDLSGIQMRLMHHARSSIVDNRNMLVQAFLGAEPPGSHLLFIDTDISVPRDGLQKLLAAGRPIISGLYVDKKEMDYVARRQEGDYEYRSLRAEWSRHPRGKSGHRWILRDELRDRVVPCDAAGAGCLLIEREVLEKVPYPWFFHDFNPEAVGQGPQSSLSSDFSFFKKAAGCGFPGFIHTGVLCYHWQGMTKFPPYWPELSEQRKQ
jgi:hypothetical protein